MSRRGSSGASLPSSRSRLRTRSSTVEGATICTSTNWSLREKGVVSAKRSGQRGDQFVEVQIVAPSTVDERVRNLLRELGQLAPEDPRRDIFARAGV